MPLRLESPFWDLEDTEYWNRNSIQMRLRSFLRKNKNDVIVRRIKRGRGMNPFHYHGVNHLSPSSVNMFSGSSTAWIARYLLGYKFSMGPSAWRGIAVEDALSAWMFKGLDVQAAANLALERFDESKVGLNFDDEVVKERKRLYRYVVNAIDAFIEFETELFVGKRQQPPIGMDKGQWSVGLPCRFGDDPNDKIDVIGYLDFLYANDDNKNAIVDLKTTARIPSEWQPAHAMQAAFYKRAHGSNPDVYFVYASPKEANKPNKFNILKLDDETYNRELLRMKESIKRMANCLRLSDNAFILAESLPHDESSFYWKGEKSLNEVIEETKTATLKTMKEK